MAVKHAAAPELAEWLEARYCANPTCDQAANDKCPTCLEARYCGRACQLAHWPVHKKECRKL